MPGSLVRDAIAVDLLATLSTHLGGNLNRVTRIVKVMSLVNSTPDFTEQHLVTNGASELLAEVFGDAGKHARAAVSVNGLPLGVSVEVQIVLEIRD